MKNQNYNDLFKEWKPQQTTPNISSSLNLERKRMELKAYQTQLQVVNAEQKERKSLTRRWAGTVGDLTAQTTQGFLKGLEGIADFGMGIAGSIGGAFGADDFENSMKQAIEYDVAGAVNPYFSKLVNPIYAGAEALGLTSKEDSFVNELNEKWQNRTRGTFSAIGQMLPAIAAGGVAGSLGAGTKLAQGVSSATFGLGAGGGATEQALKEGANLSNATIYGALSGAMETAVEMASGGIGGVGKGYLGKIFPNVAKKLTAKASVRIASNMLGEGLEEVVSELASPYLKQITYNPNADLATMEDLTESFVLGAMIGGIMGSGSAYAEAHRAKIEQATEAYNNGELTKEQAQELKQESEVLLEQTLVNTEQGTEDAVEGLNEAQNGELIQEQQVVEQKAVEQPTEQMEEQPTNVKAQEIVATEQQAVESDNKTLVQNENGEYEVKDVETVQELDYGLKLVKDSDGKYNVLIKDGVLMFKNSLAKEQIMEKYNTQKKQWDGDESNTLDRIDTFANNTYEVQRKNGNVAKFNELIKDNTEKTTSLTVSGGKGGKGGSGDTNARTNNPLRNVGENVDTSKKVAVSEDMTKPKKSWWQELKRKYVNSMVGVENFLKGKVKNPETLTHKAKLSSSVASDWFENGVSKVVTEKNGKTKVVKKSKPFVKVFEFLSGKGKEYKRKYFEYLLHKHNISRMDIPFETKATQEQIDVLDLALSNNEISQELYDVLTNTENKTKCSTIRNLIIEHTDIMQDTTLDTILELVGDQKPIFSKEVSFESSQQKVAEFEKTNPEFKQHAKDIYDYNNALLERQVEEGIITQETKDHFNETYPFYVPTHRLQYNTSNAGIKQGTIQSGIKTAKGSDLVVRDIMEQIFHQTQLVARSISINPLLKTLGDNADGENVIKSSNVERLDDVNKIGETRNNKNQFTYFEQGEKKIKQVTIVVSEEIAQGIKSLSPIEMDVDMNSSLKKVRRVNSWFKKVTTSLNPFFSFWRNPIRDIQNALTYTKFSIKDYSRNFGKSFRIIFFDRKNVEWQTYIASGGKSASIFDYEKGMKTANTKAGKLMNKIEDASQLIEQLPRFAEYLASREKGMSVDEAILNSAEVTTNFVRSGTVMRTLNSTFMPFSNPKLQGSLKFFRTFATAGSKRKIMLFAIRCAVLGITPSIINNLLYDDDDEYKDVRQQDKNLNYLFKIGGTWIKIPKGQLISGISATYNRTKNYAKGEDFAYDGYLKELSETISPVENLRTIFSPFIDVKTNTTWYGGNIEGMKFNNVRPKDRYDEATSWIASGIGKVTNYSPKKIHYLLDQYTGVIGDILLPMTTPKYDQGALEKTFVYDATASSKYSSQFYKLLEEANYKKTDGDLLAKARVKFLNKVSNNLSELYKEQQKINQSKISEKEKEQQVKTIQILINNTQKNAIENVKTFEKIISNFELSEDSFEEDYRHATKLAFGSEIALQTYNKTVYQKASALSKAKIDFDTFYDVYFDTKEFSSELDELGNAISGSKKAQISAYIELLPISSIKKYMLFGSLGYKSAQGEEAVKKYVKMLGLSKEEQNEILSACNYD